MRNSLLFIVLLVFGTCLSACATDGDPRESGFTPIFDGETLDGWKVVGGNATFKVEDGELVGTCKDSRPNTFLRTVRDDYRDFELRCQFKWDIPGNSGIQFRSAQKNNGAGVVYGYQYEIDSSERAWTAGVQEESRRGWLYPLKGEENQHKRAAVKLDGWNDVVIRCEGRHIQTWLNGVAIADFTDDADNAMPEGFFALQIHWGESSQVRWRDLRIKELKAEPQ